MHHLPPFVSKGQKANLESPSPFLSSLFDKSALRKVLEEYNQDTFTSAKVAISKLADQVSLSVKRKIDSSESVGTKAGANGAKVTSSGFSVICSCRSWFSSEDS